MFQKKAKKFEILAEIEDSLITKKKHAIERIGEMEEFVERDYWQESELNLAKVTLEAVVELLEELQRQYK